MLPHAVRCYVDLVCVEISCGATTRIERYWGLGGRRALRRPQRPARRSQTARWACVGDWVEEIGLRCVVAWLFAGEKYIIIWFKSSRVARGADQAWPWPSVFDLMGVCGGPSRLGLAGGRAF